MGIPLLAPRIILEYIPAYTPGKTSRSEITRQEARELVAQGSAKWINRCRAIELLKRDDRPKVHDLSCIMPPKVTEAAADGKPWAIEIRSAWQFGASL